MKVVGKLHPKNQGLSPKKGPFQKDFQGICFFFFGGGTFYVTLLEKKNPWIFFFGSVFHQLMANWWFGARWFGIRIRIPLTNNPFHFRGSQKSKPRGPNQTTKLTIKNSWLKGVLGTNKNKLWNKKHKLPGFGWFQMGFKGWFGMFISNPVTEVQFTHLLCFAKGENVPRVGVQRKDESGTRDEVVDLGSTIPDVLERGEKPKGLRKGACCSPRHVFLFLFFLLVKILFGEQTLDWDKKDSFKFDSRD